MSVINREDAIAELMSLLPKLERGLIHWTGVKAMLEALPSAQPERKPIDYRDCADAMLMMWMWNVLTDGEYYRIMDKLNKHEVERRNDE